MKDREHRKTVLALYPNWVGVNYAVFDFPKDVVDYGTGHVRPVSSKKSLQRVEQYLEFFQPDVVVLRGLTHPKLAQNKRNQKLLSLIVDKAKALQLPVFQYDRRQIREVFSQWGAYSKYQVSKQLTEWFPELEAIAYPYRKQWMAENHNVGVFDALSLGIVHYYLNSEYHGDFR